MFHALADASSRRICGTLPPAALLRAQAYVAIALVFFALFIGLCAASAWVENLWVLGLASYTVFFCVIALIRADIMVAYNLRGDVGRNMVAAALFYPFCIGQMYGQLQRKRPKAQVFSASQASFKLRTNS